MTDHSPVDQLEIDEVTQHDAEDEWNAWWLTTQRNTASDPLPSDPTECRRCGRNPYKQGYAGCICGA